jgi:hypothetical protein
MARSRALIPAEWLPHPVFSLRPLAQASGMHRTRRDAPFLSHVRLTMSRRDKRGSETAYAARGAQDSRTRSAEMARWENEGGALRDSTNGERLIGVHNASSP